MADLAIGHRVRRHRPTDLSGIPAAIARVLTDEHKDAVLAGWIRNVLRRKPPVTLRQRDALDTITRYPGVTTVWLRDELGSSSCAELYLTLQRLDRKLLVMTTYRGDPADLPDARWWPSAWGRRCAGDVLRSRA